jgi:hypothetical protein
MTETLRTFSYGGGVQSTAALALAARGVIDFKTFLFCNVGDDSEHPATLDYFYEYAGPFAERHGIAMHELQRRKRNGQVETLYGRLTREGSRSIPIPMRTNDLGAPGTRSCTADFKIRLVAKWQRQHGATAERPAVAGLGISLDELQRARTASGFDYQTLEYPLIALRLTRQDCINVITDAGLPVPPKSSCWFCPFHTLQAWQRQREDEPELFGKSVALEALLNERRAMLGKDLMWLTRKLVPLDQATSPHRQLPMFADDQADACESGYCMT